MWARNQSCDTKWAQEDDVDLGAAPGEGGNRFPADADEQGHATYTVQNKAVCPSTGDALHVSRFFYPFMTTS
jgi:hypothetical protein